MNTYIVFRGKIKTYIMFYSLEMLRGGASLAVQSIKIKCTLVQRLNLDRYNGINPVCLNLRMTVSDKFSSMHCCATPRRFTIISMNSLLSLLFFPSPSPRSSVRHILSACILLIRSLSLRLCHFFHILFSAPSLPNNPLVLTMFSCRNKTSLFML